MSDQTTTTDPTPATTVTVAPSADTIGSFWDTIHNAAGSVYHKIVAIEADVAAWTSSTSVKPLVDDAVNLVEAVLSAHGIPVPALELVARTIFGALGTMAASDATVVSGSANKA